ncbi:MAG: ATP synthase F0 subunit C [Candidatus Dojkabacteria bacterium]|nr:ATP synthase F0 subunit C [Candidatus Dojkabacteria bacterium]
MEELKYIAIALAIGLGTLGPGIGLGLTASKAVEALGRNPEVENKIRTLMILGMGLIEVLAIFALVIAFLIAFVL